ncbi:hypothetical protein [Nocardia sp. NPDC127526]|uniref:hypothetical protein n=1 Tax=Nocardia sp. NPDC127526 TaxID=3345393 RepID=UPI0036265DBB
MTPDSNTARRNCGEHTTPRPRGGKGCWRDDLALVLDQAIAVDEHTQAAIVRLRHALDTGALDLR